MRTFGHLPSLWRRILTARWRCALGWLVVLARDELIAGRYRIVRWIGEGACATVYEAADVQIGGRAVALRS